MKPQTNPSLTDKACMNIDKFKTLNADKLLIAELVDALKDLVHYVSTVCLSEDFNKPPITKAILAIKKVNGEEFTDNEIIPSP